MNLFELFVKIGVDDQASDKISSLSSKLGSGLATAAKVGAAAVAAAGTAIVAIGKQAVEQYAEYEQLVGGVETLFKQSSDVVQQYAANAYKTAGMSANEYMETVTSFSASLLQSLGGDTEAASKYADMAITDMSDNANKMGTSMESIQNAYQGFAKQNYTMLDNLKLGYGGTKEEMQRLLDDAEKLSGVEYDISSYADIVDAIHVVQTEMGITGTTAKEASETISGSTAAMKSAWQNLLVGMADDNADFGQLVNNLVDSAVTVGENIIPRVEQTIQGLATFISSASDTIIPLVVDTIVNNLPMIVSAGVDLVVSLAGALIDAIPELLKAIPQIILAIVNGFKSLMPQIIDIGKSIVTAIGDGIKNLASDAFTWGKDLIDNFIGGIKEKIQNLKDTVSNVAQAIKDFLGFSEPEKGPLSNFHTYAPDMMNLFIKGIRDNEKKLTDQIEKTFDFGERTITAGISYGSYGDGVFSSGGGYGARQVPVVQNSVRAAIHDEISKIGIYLDGNTLVGGISDRMNQGLGSIYAGNERRAMA